MTKLARSPVRAGKSREGRSPHANISRGVRSRRRMLLRGHGTTNMGFLSLFKRPSKSVETDHHDRSQVELLKLQREAEKLAVEIAKTQRDDARADSLLVVEKGKLSLAKTTAIATAFAAVVGAATFGGTLWYQSNQIQTLRDQNQEGNFAALVQQLSTGPSPNARLAAATGLELYLDPRQERYYSRTLRLLILSMDGEEAPSVRTLVADILVRHANLDSLRILYAQNQTVQKKLADALQVPTKDLVYWCLPFKSSPTDAEKKSTALLAWNTRVLADSLQKFVEGQKTVTSELSPIGVFWSLPTHPLTQTPPQTSGEQWDLPDVGMIAPQRPDAGGQDQVYAHFWDIHFQGVHFSGSKLSNLAFHRCTFEGCDFENVALDGTAFYDCQFIGGIFAGFWHFSVVDHLVDLGHPPTWENCEIVVAGLWPRIAYEVAASPLPPKLQNTACFKFIKNKSWKINKINPVAQPHFDFPLEGSGTQVGTLK